MEGGAFIEIGFPIAIGLITISMGLSLTLSDFARVLRRPIAVTVGLIAQMIGLPLLAFGVASSLSLDPVYALGIVLIGACPGGSTSNLIVHFADADRALSVTLTAISNSVVFITLPLVLSLGLSTFGDGATTVELPALTLMLQLFGLTLVPLAFGMAVRARKPDLASRLEGPGKKFAGAFIGLLVVGVVAANFQLVISEGKRFAGAFIALNVLATGMGYGLAKLARQGPAQAVTIALESGLQNTTLALFVALTLLDNEQLATVPALYGGWMLLVGFSIAMVVGPRLRSSKTALESA